MNSLNCLFSFDYYAVMSTKMNKQTHENRGLVVFLLLRTPVGATDVSVSRVVIMVKPKMFNVHRDRKKITKEMVENNTLCFTR